MKLNIGNISRVLNLPVPPNGRLGFKAFKIQSLITAFPLVVSFLCGNIKTEIKTMRKQIEFEIQ